MAICLDDLKKSKRLGKEVPKSVKSRSLRPWESYDEIDCQTRTVGAQEAVAKAREIVKLNNKMVDNLRLGIKSEERLKELDRKLERDKYFFSSFDTTVKKPYKIKSKGGLFGLFRDIFRT
jgi:hypothetical protein